MRRANQELAELAAQQKAVALGGSAQARYQEAQVNAANQCLHRLELSGLEEVQHEMAALQQQLNIDQQVHEVWPLLLLHQPVSAADTSFALGERVGSDLMVCSSNAAAGLQSQAAGLAMTTAWLQVSLWHAHPQIRQVHCCSCNLANNVKVMDISIRQYVTWACSS